MSRHQANAPTPAQRRQRATTLRARVILDLASRGLFADEEESVNNRADSSKEANDD